MTDREYGCYDFGLASGQEEAARALHESSIVIDLHFQGPLSPDVWTAEHIAELEAELDQRGADGEHAWQFLTEKALRGELPEYREMFTASGATTDHSVCALKDESTVLEAAYKAARLTRTFDWARRARTADDIRRAKAAGGVALWGICAQNQLRPEDLRLVAVAHELGVLDVCELAYNTMNFIGAGCMERYDAGLSRFGERFVRECNAVGVIVDTAHTGKQSTLDACEASRTPVVATHTSAEAIFPHARAKSDDEFRAIAATGGVIGVYTIPHHLGPPKGEPPTIQTMLDHIDYIAQLVGWEHVAIGTDWPIALPYDIQRRVFGPHRAEMGHPGEDEVDRSRTMIGFRDPRDLLNITRGLVSRGYGEAEVRGILGENFLRVFQQVCG